MSKPFLKWAGGKRKLAETIVNLLPKEINTYFEPFLGGGAIFFELAKQNRFKKAKISDINEELVVTYKAVRDNVDGVIENIEKLLAKGINSENYYSVRAIHPWQMRENPEKIAARMIYLNHLCFNGLYRVNSHDEFNVPFGKYANPTILDKENLRNVARTLQGVEIVTEDFERATLNAHTGDVIFLDPPYLPVKAESFTTYTKLDFDELDHDRLAMIFGQLQRKGAFVLESNSDARKVRSLYEKFCIMEVRAPRRINSSGAGRGDVTELLICSKNITQKKGQ